MVGQICAILTKTQFINNTTDFLTDLGLAIFERSLQWYGNGTMQPVPNLLTLCQLRTLAMSTFASTISSKSLCKSFETNPKLLP